MKTKKRKISFKRGFLVGMLNGLLFWLFLGTALIVWPMVKEEIEFRTRKSPPQPEIVAPDAHFSLVIPKINARSRIIASVDASKPKDYQAALQKGVAHAKGTVFPGMKGTIYLFAHSTDSPLNVSRYNAVFYLLKEMVAGDEIVVFFEGKRYNYQVTETKIVPRREITFFSQKNEELLVLQTCYPPGTTQKAFLVYAKPRQKS